MDGVLPWVCCCDVGWVPQAWRAWGSGPSWKVLDWIHISLGSCVSTLEQSWTPELASASAFQAGCRWTLSFSYRRGRVLLAFRRKGGRWWRVWDRSDVCVLTPARCALWLPCGSTFVLPWKEAALSSFSGSPPWIPDVPGWTVLRAWDRWWWVPELGYYGLLEFG